METIRPSHPLTGAPAPAAAPESLPEASAARWVLFFACAAHALTHVYIVIFAAVLDEMRLSFAMTVEELTRYAAISTTLFGLGALPASWLGERFGEKRMLVAFFLLTAAGGAVVGAAAGPASLAAGMTLLGLGTSIFHPVGNTYIAKTIANPGRAMGTNGLWGNIGEAAGPVLAVIAAAVSWRWAYIGLALPTIALGLWLARLPIPVRAVDGGLPAPGGRTPIRGTLALLFLAMLCAGLQFWLVKTMLPTHLKESSLSALPSHATQKAGLLTALVYLVGAAGQHLSGRLVQHRDGRGLYAIILAAGAALLLAVSVLEGWLLLAAAGLMSLLLFAAQPVENVLLARLAPPGWKSTLFGLKFTLAFGVGGIGTLLAGAIQERSGTSAVFLWAGAAALPGALCVLGALRLRLRLRQ